jgi:hypothetical protein
MTTEPLLKKLLRYVMSDEARHVAFGVLSLKEYYAELSDAEMLERQEFAFEAAVRMRDRFLQQEVWARMGLDVKAVLPLVMNAPERQMFQSMLFAKIVPNCKKLGLLDRNDGWLRKKFTELGVIQFEDWADTEEEYEIFALAAFGFMHMLTEEPLLKQLLRYVMSDEARHVAFGVLSLKEYYGELTDAEMLERQQFAFEAAVRMRDRFLQQEVWERMGVDVRTMIKLQLENQGDKNEDPFQQLLFSKIVPNCKKLGLLDRNNGWLRTKFGEMGVIQFEDWADTGEEYDTMSLEAMANEQAGGAEVA